VQERGSQMQKGVETTSKSSGFFSARPTPGVDPAAGYQGGDFAGITAKILDNHFTKMGFNALWISPPMDNTDKAKMGTGYDTHMHSAYHGYRVRDAFKTEKRLCPSRIRAAW